MFTKHHFIFALLVFFFSGCTTITVHNSDGQVSVERAFGIPVVEVEPNNSTVLIETKALGIANSSETFSIGYLNESYALAGKECEIILFTGYTFHTWDSGNPGDSAHTDNSGHITRTCAWITLSRKNY